MPATKPKTKTGKKKAMQAEMHKFKTHTLHSGSATGPLVTNRDQALAISLAVSGQTKPKAKKKGR